MPEHQTIEWKESWHDEYLEWICGYANAYGGTLYIGKDDTGNVVGIEKKSKKWLEMIPSKITDTMGIVVDVNLVFMKIKYIFGMMVKCLQIYRPQKNFSKNILPNRIIQNWRMYSLKVE